MKNADTIQEREERSSVFFCSLRGEGEDAGAMARVIKSEKGVVLIVVLVMSAVVLAVMTALIYMVTSGTQISGMQKRYKTALEAARGGSDLVYEVIGLRGDTSTLSNVIPTILGPSACTGKDPNTGTTYTGFQAKLWTSSSTWSAGCNSSLTTDPTNTSVYPYDIIMVIGTSPKYTYYAKIVGTQQGNSGATTGLYTGSVITGSGGIGAIPVVSQPYLYAIEVNTENANNPAERAKLSILYQY